MVWSLACLGGGRFAAFVPVAGAFWEPLPGACPSGPANLYHVHGLSDGTVPMAGRAIGTRFRQGDVLKGMALWRDVNACPAEPTRTERDGSLACSIWAGCASGRELRLCLQGDGHEYRPDWVSRGWAVVDRVARERSGANGSGAPTR